METESTDEEIRHLYGKTRSPTDGDADVPTAVRPPTTAEPTTDRATRGGTQ